MKRMEPVSSIRWAMAIGAAVLAVAPIAANDETRASMQDVFGAMRVLLPLSLSAERFEDPANRLEIDAALARLESSSGRLAAHGRGENAAFEMLSGSLAADARDLHSRWTRGHRDEARFIVQQLTETCVACHSRLPSDRDSPLSARFASEEFVRSLPLRERAKLEYATRQFESALESYEAMLASTEITPSTLDLGGYLDEYLEICIRVRTDPARGERALQGFLRRPGLTPALRAEVERWIGSLRELASQPRRASTLDEARALVDRAEDRKRFADEREALVLYLEASSVLYRALEGSLPERRDRARAYYLLGLVDTRIGRAFWLSQAESLLEASIRLAPETKTAAKAYALLEDFLIAGFTGSAGTQVPPDIQELLDELETLVRESRTQSPASS